MNTAHFSRKNYLDRNAIINISVITVSITLSVFLGSLLWLLVWPIFILIDDFTLSFLNFSAFDTEIAIKRGYQFAHYYLNQTSNDGRDLGFNFYNGDLKKSREQAQKDKWDFVIKSLKLKAGDRLIDIGCGYGDWIKYAKSKGIEVVGVNISPEQADYAREINGLEVICTNWKDIPESSELREKLYGKFDAVTLMDTIEHYVHVIEQRADGGKNTYSKLYDMVSNLLKPGANGRVFSSTLHINEKFVSKENPLKLDLKGIPTKSLIRYFFSNLLKIRYHSGSYPKGKVGLVKYAEKHFNLLEAHDLTEDYRLTGVLDKDHFQAPLMKITFNKIMRAFLLFLLDPHHLHKWIDIKYDAWMNFYGENAYSIEYNPEFRRNTSYMILYWHLLELRSK